MDDGVAAKAVLHGKTSKVTDELRVQNSNGNLRVTYPVNFMAFLSPLEDSHSFQGHFLAIVGPSIDISKPAAKDGFLV